jgi:hypothetical protein
LHLSAPPSHDESDDQQTAASSSSMSQGSGRGLRRLKAGWGIGSSSRPSYRPRAGRWGRARGGEGTEKEGLLGRMGANGAAVEAAAGVAGGRAGTCWSETGAADPGAGSGGEEFGERGCHSLHSMGVGSAEAESWRFKPLKLASSQPPYRRPLLLLLLQPHDNHCPQAGVWRHHCHFTL